MNVLNDIAGELLESMPEVSQHAIDEHDAAQQRNLDANMLGSEQTNSTTPASASNPNGWPLDGRGNAYNPETHEVSASTGKAIKKRRGTKSSVGAPDKNTNQPQAQAVTTNEQKAAANGMMAALATFAALQGIFGEEFKPRADSDLGDEFQYLSGAYGNYFLAKGFSDIPAGWALAIAVGSIAAPRFAMPKTKSKLQRLKDFCIGKFFTWRAKKTVKRAENVKDESV